MLTLFTVFAGKHFTAVAIVRLVVTVLHAYSAVLTRITGALFQFCNTQI